MILIGRTDVHPCRKKELEDVMSYGLLSRRLLKLVRRKKTKLIGTVQLKEYGGRPDNVYCGYPIKPDWIEHEVRLTCVFKALGWPDVLRGFDVPRVNGVMPDAAMGKFRFEMDCASEGQDEIEKKVRALRGTNQPVLFVTTTEARLRKLIRWTKDDIGDIALFCLWSEIIAKGWVTEWQDYEGTKARLT